jgi:copper chaperone NosL
MQTLKIAFVAAVVVSLGLPGVWAGEKAPIAPSPRDKCPVCGMFVSKYPDWVGGVVYKDGFVVFFDGAKDLFKYCFNLKQYHRDRARADIRDIYVTEYYDVKLIHAQEAFFVIGSDVYGPMGRELVPFKTEADAKAFMQDHKGKRMVRFEQVTPALIQKLDE